MDNLSRPVRELLSQYALYLEERTPQDSESNIQVDEIASKIASFYEKLRGFIDYQENHLIRKNVIDRVLRRRVFLKDISGEKIAEPLIKEIIRSGHLPNNALPETKIYDVQRIIDTLLALLTQIEETPPLRAHGFSDWLIGVSVCAIEECLVPPDKDRMLTDAMLSSLRETLPIHGETTEETDTNALLFIAVQKALLHVDRDQLHYRLLELMMPDWELSSPEQIPSVAEGLVATRESISRYIKHPQLRYFLAFCHRHTIVFRILGDLVFGSKGFENLKEDVASLYEARYQKEKGRLFRMAFLSVLSFFFSKILVAVAIEVPVDLFIIHNFSLPHMVANIIFPPLLMLIIVASIRLPSRKNLLLVQQEIESVAFAKNQKNRAISFPKKKSLALSLLMQFIYLSVFGITIYFLSRLLLSFGFTILSIVVFLLFTSLVTAVGVKIHNRSREMSLEKARPKFFGFILDLFTMPLVTIGKWLMSGLKKFNVFVIFVNLVVELPFQLLIELLENFHEFMKRKKEEIQ